MPFKDVAVFALVMILMGLLLTAPIFAAGLIVSLFSGKATYRRGKRMSHFDARRLRREAFCLARKAG